MTESSPKISSKVALITGASSGIGEATARHLAANGYPVVLGARRTDRITSLARQIQEAGGQAFFQELDVTDLGSVQSFVASAEEHYGRVDVLINNAGVMPLSLMEDLRIDEWNQMIDVNLRGVLYGIACGHADHAQTRRWTYHQRGVGICSPGRSHRRRLLRNQVRGAGTVRGTSARKQEFACDSCQPWPHTQ
ncbi:short chain dehydrogenase [Paraburkholderia aspalathi]|jgi:NAD(P)-dependent dehydrogenase (short-subunit alcohol dehydrogenase family)|uniref:Short chain dehydrogenase n=1 Tax=Paraburkholderia aspalathi TaxID=1324617 RepID=A0A1I7EQQ0_9BURK|nr:short chain dehydrogenase [Paraburkholderia aspalathi]